MKHFKKRLVSFSSAIVLVLATVATAFAAGGSTTGTAGGSAEQPLAVIYYTNDVHGAYENMGKVKTLVDAEHALLVDAGDAIQGSIATTLTKGQAMVDMMRAMGYVVAVPGNHEFDYGMDRFLEIATDKAKDAIPYVCANFQDISDKNNPKNVLEAYTIIDADGDPATDDDQIAFVGITTPYTLTSSTPAYFQNAKGDWIYNFTNDTTGEALYGTVQKAIDDATKEGADYIVAVGHMGIVEEGSDIWTSREVIKNTSGIDAFIDGHSHSTVPQEKVKDKDGNEVVLTQTGSKLKNVGRLEIAENGVIESKMIAITDDMASDAEIQKKVDQITQQVKAASETKVATTEVDLVTDDPATGNRLIRSGETNLGDLCADAYRDLLKTDIAFVNGGGIRATIKAGDITNGQIIDVHPYGNTLCSLEVTGQQILDALELGASESPNESGGFLQVSGLTYEIHNYLPSGVQRDENNMFAGVKGERRVQNVKVGGVAIDPAKTYTLGGHNYMLLQSGDGFSMFKDAKVLQKDVMPDNETLIRYITQTLNGKIKKTADTATSKTPDYSSPYGEGRIQILSTKPAGTAGFADVKADSWYAAAVKYVSDQGIMSGVGGNNFGPGEKLTRGMIAQILYNMEGKPEVGSNTSSTAISFTDVAADKWYSSAIHWAAARGIVSGYSNGSYGPNDYVTRQQLALILWKHAGSPAVDAQPADAQSADAQAAVVSLDQFKDADSVANYAKDALLWATRQGILSGRKDGTLDPKGQATRAEVAQMLMSYSEAK